MNEEMELAIGSALDGIRKNEGGPFGATIVDKDGNVIAVAHNEVIKNNDPTAHAEIQAIRMAAKKLNTYDLTGCKIYASSQPCPMCLSAIIWSNIKEIYYGASKEDAARIGFRDDAIYEYIKGKNNLGLNVKQIDRNKAIKPFEEYNKNNGVIY